MNGPLLALMGAFAVLIAIQMLRPRFLHRRMSSWRFFRPLPPPQSQSQLAFRPPTPTRLFWLRLVVWGLALIALLATERLRRKARVESLGLWVWLDTSASMTARDGSGSRWDEALRAAAGWPDRLATQYPGAQIEWRLSAFDETRQDISIGSGSARELKLALRSLGPRALGTNLHLIAAAASMPATLSSGRPVTHVIVISDTPRPAIFADAAIPVVWHEIGSSAPNTGFTAIAPARDPFTGAVARVRLSLQRSGALDETPCVLAVRTPGGKSETRLPPLTWRSDGYAETELPTPLSGLYEVRIEAPAGGACAFDDEIAFKIPPARTVRAEWRAPQADWPRHLGWESGAGADVDLRVVSMDEALVAVRDNIPLLILAPAEGTASRQKINLFDDAHPLLADINLDVLEREIPAFPIPAGLGCQFVVRAGPGQGWIATRPRACVIPEPAPFAATDSAATRLRHTLFFNAIRHLLVEKPLPPLFSVTSPANPAPSLPLAHLPLHGEEGLTLKLRPPPDPDPFVPATTAPTEEKESRWPPWVAFASVIATLEAGIALAGGGRWN